MTRPALSVLTPTYNRAHVLHRAYDSLNRQNSRDFEWVEVDDGSTDDTPALLARWQSEADFPITWLRYDNNRGQIPAVNEGRKLVKGEYTLKLDSDDALLDDAMDVIEEWRIKTGIDTKQDTCGLVFRCLDEFGRIVGKMENGEPHYPDETMIMSTREARYGFGMIFDKAHVQKTETLSLTRYGELDCSENLPPSIGANRISDYYKVIYIDRPIRIYFRHYGGARLSDKPTKHVKTPRGNYLRALAVLNEDIDWFWKRPKIFLNAGRKMTRMGLHIDRSPRQQFKDLSNGRARLLWALGIVGGCTGYLRDRLRGRTAPAAAPDISAWGPAALPENPVLHPPPGRLCKQEPQAIADLQTTPRSE